MTDAVRFTSTRWKTKRIKMMQHPKDQPGFDDLTDEEKEAAIEVYERYAGIDLEVRRVGRAERQKWEREFALLLANDPVIKKNEDSGLAGLHPSTLAGLEEFNEKIANAAIVRVFGLLVGDTDDDAIDVSEVTPEEAIEFLAECGLLGYAAKAARVAQTPTVRQGES